MLDVLSESSEIMNRKFVSILLGIFISCTSVCYAQETEFEKYHRSSLYSILLKHPEKEFCNEMIEAFKAIPIPEKYNNHDLKIKVMPAPVLKSLTKAEIEGAYRESIEKILSRNKIGGRLIEKWFNRIIRARRASIYKRKTRDRSIY